MLLPEENAYLNPIDRMARIDEIAAERREDNSPEVLVELIAQAAHIAEIAQSDYIREISRRADKEELLEVLQKFTAVTVEAIIRLEEM